MASIHSEGIDRLFRCLQTLRTEEEFYAFFEDLCTVKELQDMAQRMETASLLDAGRSYQEISEQVGVSSATIGRVNRCLKYGSGGYRLVLDRLREAD